MPDHVHLVVERLKLRMEQLSIQLKKAATLKLVEVGIHPFQQLKPHDGPPPKCFAVGEWKGYLDPDDVARCVKYVEQNPVKDGLPSQVGLWPFVTDVEF
jgi:REP element-mobilizing transposase RayT